MSNYEDNTCEWVMRVPVLSTGHLRENYSSDFEFDLVNYVKTYGGCIVFVPDLQDSYYDHLHKIWEWMNENFPGEAWIRFDEDGDTINSLEQYNW